jgi:hypothetical protein
MGTTPENHYVGDVDKTDNDFCVQLKIENGHWETKSSQNLAYFSVALFAVPLCYVFLANGAKIATIFGHLEAELTS